MSKAGMRRPDPKEPHGTESNRKTHIPKNAMPPVPEIEGKTNIKIDNDQTLRYKAVTRRFYFGKFTKRSR